MNIEHTLWLIILTLSQAVLIALQIIRTRNDRRHRLSNGGNSDSLADPPPCKEHGERLVKVETKVEDIEKTVERIERKLNGV
jgi:hypothetical protein